VTQVQPTESLGPFLTYSLAVIALLAVTLTVAWFLGGRVAPRRATVEPFESGVVPVGEADSVRLSIEFFLVAMFFVIFDLETIFVFAWAVGAYELGWAGYAAVACFITILLVALVYELGTGALDWGVRQRSGPDRARYAARGESA
jgi:NADH-quinone oxidoreductase subunit A